jgi:hypothetical protein
MTASLEESDNALAVDEGDLTEVDHNVCVPLLDKAPYAHVEARSSCDI